MCSVFLLDLGGRFTTRTAWKAIGVLKLFKTRTVLETAGKGLRPVAGDRNDISASFQLSLPC